MINILLAPDKFKGSLSSETICEIANKVAQDYPKLRLDTLPLADGGDGSIDVLQENLSLTRVDIATFDALHRPIQTYYMLSKDGESAYIEMSKSVGLAQISTADINIMKTSSYGFGLMIREAIFLGVKKIFLFIGGSATNDAGLGAARALGFKFFDDQYNQLLGLTEDLSKVAKIINSDFDLPQIFVVSDVNNIMHGKQGAAHVYAKQKGANEEQIEQLDKGLKNLSLLFESRRQGSASIKGGGAAGAFGAGAFALFKAEIQDGFSFLSDQLGLLDKIRQCDILIAAEGGLDNQSFYGKVVGNLYELAKKNFKEFYIICGKVEDKDQLSKLLDINKIYSVMNHARSVRDAMINSESHLAKLFHLLFQSISTR
jgi:glycerate 2-kinase